MLLMWSVRPPVRDFQFQKTTNDVIRRDDRCKQKIVITSKKSKKWSPELSDSWLQETQLRVCMQDTANANYSGLTPQTFTRIVGSELYRFLFLVFSLILWSPYVLGQAIIFLLCGFFFYLSFFYPSFFPRLISAVADWVSTILPHMVWPQCEFRMQV